MGLAFIPGYNAYDLARRYAAKYSVDEQKALRIQFHCGTTCFNYVNSETPHLNVQSVHLTLVLLAQTWLTLSSLTSLKLNTAPCSRGMWGTTLEASVRSPPRTTRRRLRW